MLMRRKRRGAGQNKVSPQDLQGSRARLDEYIRDTAESILKLIPTTEGWERPWKNAEGMTSLPYNAVSGHRYSGGNALSLMIASCRHGYSDPRFLTYKQAEEIAKDSHVRRGAKGVMLMRPIIRDVEVTEKADDELVSPEDAFSDFNPDTAAPGTRRLVYFRPFYVYNAAQIENMPALEVVRPTTIAWDESAANPVLRLTQATKVDLRHGGNRAFYSPKHDYVQLPDASQFDLAEHYCSTLLHEWFHWTGHDDREARDLSGGFGSPDYAREELRAEIFSVLVGGVLGLPVHLGQHAAYVRSWQTTLKSDPKTVFKAAVEASRMLECTVDFLQGDQPKPSWFPPKESWPEAKESHEQDVLSEPAPQFA